MPKLGIVIGGTVLLATGAVIGWSIHHTVEGGGGADGGGEEEAPEIDPNDMTVRVKTAVAVRGDLPTILVAMGQVRADPSAMVALSSRASGRVAEVHGAPGMEVKRGAPLVVFETAPLEAAVLEARARLAEVRNKVLGFDRSGRDIRIVELQSAVQRAASEQRIAEAQYERTASLFKDGLASEKQVEETRGTAERARLESGVAERTLDAFRTSGSDLERATLNAAAAAAESALNSAESVFAESRVTAPADGRLLTFAARRGDTFDPGADLGTLLVTDARLISFGLPAAATVAPGMPVSWRSAGGPRRTGSIARIVDEAAAATGLVEVFAIPDEDMSPGLPGVVVRGEIVVGTRPGVVLVPESAVFRREDRHVVVTVGADGAAHVVAVTVLGRFASQAGVVGAIESGARLIVDGAYNLPDGAHVTEDDGSPEAPSPRGDH